MRGRGNNGQLPELLIESESSWRSLLVPWGNDWPSPYGGGVKVACGDDKLVCASSLVPKGCREHRTT